MVANDSPQAKQPSTFIFITPTWGLIKAFLIRGNQVLLQQLTLDQIIMNKVSLIRNEMPQITLHLYTLREKKKGFDLSRVH